MLAVFSGFDFTGAQDFRFFPADPALIPGGQQILSSSVDSGNRA